MTFSDLEFFVSEALIGMRRSFLMSFISIVTITVCLIIFGSFMLVSLNFNNFANFVSSKLEVRVFLNESLTQKEIDDYQAKIGTTDGVKRIEFVDKSDAWKTFSEQFKNIQLTDMVDKNPLPHMVRVFLKPEVKISEFAQSTKRMKYYVEDVSYGGEIAERIELVSRYTRLGGVVLVTLLGVATLLIIVNTIRLTVIARQEEITIMKLVGATNNFIKWPFLIEGLLIGVIGSILAIGFLKGSYSFFGVRFQETFPFLPLVYDSKQIGIVYSMVVAVGTFLGILGAYISVSKSLKST